MKTKLVDLKYGDLFTLLPLSTIVYKVISGPADKYGVRVKDASGAVGRLSGSRYVYKIEKEDYYV